MQPISRASWLARHEILTLVLLAPASAPEADIRRAWHADTYVLKDGSSHHVDGLILFSESDRAVVYFVEDDDGKPHRGAGEGGTNTLDANRLVLTRTYLVIASEEIKIIDFLSFNGWGRHGIRVRHGRALCRLESIASGTSSPEHAACNGQHLNRPLSWSRRSTR